MFSCGVVLRAVDGVELGGRRGKGGKRRPSGEVRLGREGGEWGWLVEGPAGQVFAKSSSDPVVFSAVLWPCSVGIPPSSVISVIRLECTVSHAIYPRRNYVHLAHSPPTSSAACKAGEATTCTLSVAHRLGATRRFSGACSACT